MPASHPYQENDLLLRIAEGDEQAFSSFFHYWFPLLAGHLQQITRSEDVANEIAQEVFLKIWLKKETLPEIVNIKSYLWVMARNRAYRELYNNARETRNRTEYIYLSDQWADQLETIEREASQHNLLSLLDQAISNLPPQQREVFLLGRKEKLPHAEIASRMGLSVNSVKKYMQRALLSITAFMKTHCPIFSPIILTFFL